MLAMWFCAPENEQSLYNKNVLNQNNFPPVLYCTLRVCGNIRECKSGDCTYFFVNDMLLHLPNISVGLSTNFVEIYLQFFKIVLQLCLHINVQIV